MVVEMVSVRDDPNAVGLNSGFIDKYFTKTPTPIEGIGLAEIAQETVRRHDAAFGDDPVLRNALDVGGEYAFRLRGEEHVWSPETVGAFPHSTSPRPASPTSTFWK